MYGVSNSNGVNSNANPSNSQQLQNIVSNSNGVNSNLKLNFALMKTLVSNSNGVNSNPRSYTPRRGFFLMFQTPTE